MRIYSISMIWEKEFISSDYPILIFKILFWYSHWVGKSYFDIQNPILTFAMSRKIQFWHSKSYFDVRTQSENPILTFKILFWHLHWDGKSKSYISRIWEKEFISYGYPILIFEILFWHSLWVGKSYFDIQNPILTFSMSRKILSWHSKSQFDIRTESENPIMRSVRVAERLALPTSDHGVAGFESRWMRDSSRT